MNARYDWSVGVGRWMGVPVRVHVLLILAVVGIFAIDWHYRDRVDLMGTGLATVLVLIGSLIIHELAHAWSCFSFGGSVQSITLAPWGGNSHLQVPDHSWQRFMVHGAGIFANGVVTALSLLLLSGMGGGLGMDALSNTFRPQPFILNQWEVSLTSIIAWVNFHLVLINLIPCFPFDGAQLLRQLFLLTASDATRLQVENTMLAVGHLLGATLLLMSFLLRNVNEGPLEPNWAVLLATGIALLFAARYDYRQQVREMFQHEDWPEEDRGLRSMSGLTDSEQQAMLFRAEQYSQWLETRQQEGILAGEDSIGAELGGPSDEEMMDEILDKLHRDGMDSLTQYERRVLERVSRRLRDRRSSV